MDKILDDLITAVKKNTRNLSVGQIKNAYLFAKEAHNGQMRHSGEPYIIHPVAVAKILIELGMDTQTVIAGLLHDVLEDTPVSFETLEKEFTQEVAYLVNGVTKLSTMKYTSRTETQMENIRKMFLAMAHDIRVIIIKLADRLHNMRTIKYVKPSKQRAKAYETMELYAPIAHRLGMSNIKEELEAISIKVLDPYACSEIEEYLEINQKARQKLLNAIKNRISERLIGENIKHALEGRVKSIYGIYRKAYMADKRFEEIYDVYAIRIILDTEIECYNMLGIVHDMFRPLPNRFKDYISTPKPNMYQSLHTTVIDSNAIPFEIQIRTWEMHYTAEYGIAAHWKYKLGMGSNKRDGFDKRLAWIRQLLEVQKESDTNDALLLSIKSDFIPEEVYAFTPQGEVKALPNGSTAIDFAYSIHSEVGNHMVGAKVNGKLVSIDHVIKTGELIEVITNAKSNGPSRDWLKVVKSSEARSKIRSWFKNKHKEENIQEGKAEFLKELKKNLINLSSKEYEKFALEVAKVYKFNEANEFYAALGYGGLSATAIAPKLRDIYSKNYKAAEPEKPIIERRKTGEVQLKHGNSIIVEDLEGCLVKFARCCNPLPGDEIIGFVTRGYGISVHRRNCPSALVSQKATAQPERWINVTWNKTLNGEHFNTNIEVVAHSRLGLFATVAGKISNAKLIMHEIDAREIEPQKSSIRITLSVESLEQLNRVIREIESVSGVISVKRYLNAEEEE